MDINMKFQQQTMNKIPLEARGTAAACPGLAVSCRLDKAAEKNLEAWLENHRGDLMLWRF